MTTGDFLSDWIKCGLRQNDANWNKWGKPTTAALHSPNITAIQTCSLGYQIFARKSLQARWRLIRKTLNCGEKLVYEFISYGRRWQQYKRERKRAKSTEVQLKSLIWKSPQEWTLELGGRTRLVTSNLLIEGVIHVTRTEISQEVWVMETKPKSW